MAGGRRSGVSAWALPMMLVVVLLVCLGTSVWIAHGTPDALQRLDPEPVPVVAEPTLTQVDYSAPATLTARLTDPIPVLANETTGIITSVSVAPGSVLSTGDEVYRVDGHPVRARASEQAFFRTLSRGDRGPDVAAAQELLNELVESASLQADGVYGASTARAVHAYAQELGLGDAQVDFSPGWFVRIPTEESTVASVALAPGMVAPTQGVEIATIRPTVESVEIVATTAGGDGEYQFLLDGTAVPVLRRDGTWQIDGEAVAELLTMTSAEDSEGSTMSVDGRIRLSTPVESVLVPAGAVITDPTGRTCVADAATYRPIPVSVLGHDVTGAVQIDSGLPAGTQILVNPIDVLGEDLTCR